MRCLSGEEEKRALEYILEASKVALSSTCENSRCGSIIVRDNEIIGRGFNSPPKNQEKQRRCSIFKESYHKKITDKTCCVHAEQRAIMDALKNKADKIIGSRLYFIRLNKDDAPSRAGRPYCTICSKMALDAGIDEFVLWSKEGVCVYKTDEYNTLSYKYS
ncbi:hypothetical protein J4461_00445 [Candidatus Pacearchaeota archaeon]|nr:hypothetical protein [Candidatus Pacearchaeota archaeon]